MHKFNKKLVEFFVPDYDKSVMSPDLIVLEKITQTENSKRNSPYKDKISI